MSKQLENQLFQFKFSAKQMQMAARKCEKEEKQERTKVKKAIEKGQNDIARIHAANAIRKQSEQANYIRLSSRLDAAASQIQNALMTRQMVSNIGIVTKNMEKAMNTMNLEQISTVMDSFEKQMENLEVQSATMEKTMQNTTASATPLDQVEQLMQQVADEHNLELKTDMPIAGSVLPAQPTAVKSPEDDLMARLTALRGSS
ncbi:Charged multivesicular body protein 1a [Gonapodya sp. JEL0774]|nr:Charged multivesicular body protein 1a [Gonapodya sp. JEL0774]